MIKISPKFFTNALNSIVNTSFATILNRITLYTGSIPVVDDTFVYNPTNFASQAIASFTPSFSTTNGLITFNITPAPVNAAVAGTATWFVVSNGSTIAFIGSIGLPNSSAPLIVQDVNAVVGSPIRPLQLAIKFTS